MGSPWNGTCCCVRRLPLEDASAPFLSLWSLSRGMVAFHLPSVWLLELHVSYISRLFGTTCLPGYELWQHPAPVLHRNRSLSKGLFQPPDTFLYQCFPALTPALGLAPSLPGNPLYSHDCYFWHDCHIRHCRHICTRGGRGPTPVWPLVHWLAV